MLRSLINQRLGRYYIKELLGRGGMAAVYRAADTVLQRDLALKILYPQHSDDAALVERFKREAITAASLEHPAIVPVYDVGEQDGLVYIAMKLLSGQTFQERLQTVGAVALAELLAVLEPVVAALDYAHARGVVHRDIKPGNIFLSQGPDGERVLLTDFGIAKQLDTPGLTTTGALIGTPDYMAPEQIAGRPVDARTDVYALGMLAFRALTGRRAFEGNTQDVLLGHLYERPPLPSELNPSLPPGLDDLIMRATDTDPAARFASAGALLHALRQVARGAANPPPQPATSPGASAVGVPPPLRQQSATALQPPPAPVAAAAPRAVAPRQTAPQPAYTGHTTVAGEPAQPRGYTFPLLAALLFALVSVGLAAALLFALTTRGNATGGVTPIPPIDTVAPSSPTSEPVAVISATATLSPTIVPPTASAEPTITATSAPSAAPPTVAPPTAAPPTAGLPTIAPLPPTSAPPPSPTVPTATQSPSPPTPTATPSPSPTALASCSGALLQGGFGRVYDDVAQVRGNLGCPTGPEVAGRASEQFFQTGMMYYWDDSNPTAKSDYIFVLTSEGQYDEYPPSVVSQLPPELPGPDPNQPVRGFGSVYFHEPGVKEQLGGWTSPEIVLENGDSGVIQFFDRGLMLYTPRYEPTGGGSIFVLFEDGSFQRFDDPPS